MKSTNFNEQVKDSYQKIKLTAQQKLQLYKKHLKELNHKTRNFFVKIWRWIIVMFVNLLLMFIVIYQLLDFKNKD